MKQCATGGCTRAARNSKAALCRACMERVRRDVARGDRPKGVHHCARCSQIGHNSATCRELPWSAGP